MKELVKIAHGLKELYGSHGTEVHQVWVHNMHFPQLKGTIAGSLRLGEKDKVRELIAQEISGGYS